ncbi:hypothetical protein [sulfur-oxidizing endosymbiont of Gigantopelta aegis]|uniref:hypothetical protein n=1 Tax=sulfur-oxidizing endosymbiont of Gigantopelta aegis TaxID=2794934 RepID=UPI001BE4B3E0|nr:hypothetical protein [sulfur-oxidizing endosymbiont of Gigantopelta aegis]
MIKLMGEARQQEKNFLLRNNPRYADDTENLVDKLIIQANSTKSRFEDVENQRLAQQIIDAAEQYKKDLKAVVEGEKENTQALATIIILGRLVEDHSVKLREDQKQELLKLEQQTTDTGKQRLDKREKADLANRIIKLMGEARQQEKNFYCVRNNLMLKSLMTWSEK